MIFLLFQNETPNDKIITYIDSAVLNAENRKDDKNNLNESDVDRLSSCNKRDMDIGEDKTKVAKKSYNS